MRKKLGYYHLPRLTWLNYLSFRVNNLDDDVFRRYMHSAGRALMRDKTSITPPIAIGDWTIEHLPNDVPLVRISSFRRNKSHLNTEIIHSQPKLARALRHQRKRRWVTKQHSGSKSPDVIQK